MPSPECGSARDGGPARGRGPAPPSEEAPPPPGNPGPPGRRPPRPAERDRRDRAGCRTAPARGRSNNRGRPCPRPRGGRASGRSTTDRSRASGGRTPEAPPPPRATRRCVRFGVQRPAGSSRAPQANQIGQKNDIAQHTRLAPDRQAPRSTLVEIRSPETTPQDQLIRPAPRDSKLLHPVEQDVPGDPQELRGPGLVPARAVQGLLNHGPLHVLERHPLGR